MSEREEYELWLCDDCTIAEVNGDYSGMDDERAEEVSRGIDALVADVGPLASNWDSETEEGIQEFSHSRCAACGTRLGGGRHRFAAFGRHEANEDQAWREHYGRGVREAEERGLEPWQARDEASRAAWTDYEARTGRKPFERNAGARGTIAPPLKSFTTPGGRRFTIGAGVHEERFPGDTLWSDSFPIFRGKKEVGTLFRNMNYGEGPFGPRWQVSGKLVWMLKRKEFPPTGLGFDVVGKDTAKDAVEAWGRNADQLLDWDEGKEVYTPYAHARNGSAYYVWVLARGSDEPLAGEGPFGPYDTLENAKTFARIGATEGAHDRAVSLGVDPKTAGFQIVRRYEAGSGDRLL